MTQGLSVPTVRVNNNVVEIVPNSYSYVPGDGDTNVRAASSGGGNSSSVHTQDAETQFSKIMFSVYPRQTEIALIRAWKANVGGNTVEHFQRAGGIAEAFKNVSVTNDPDVKAAADSVIAIEMAGDKLP